MAQSTTIYLQDRQEFRRRINELELEHDKLWHADKHEIHQAIVQVTIDNPNLLLEKVEEIRDE